MSRRAELDMIAFDVGTEAVTQGRVQLRWRLMSWNEAKQQWNHDDYVRVEVDADTDLDATITAIEDHIEQVKGYGRPPATDRDYIAWNVERTRTPEVRSAVAADRAEKKRIADESHAAAVAEVKRIKDDREASVARAAKELLREAGVDLDAIAAERQAKAAGGSKA